MAKGFDRLPPSLIQQASIRGSECAWPVEAIPKLIEAGRSANLVSIGGQLQFRIPEGGTCECYWVDVDTYRDLPDQLAWKERVEKSAEAAQEQFRKLQDRYDFVAEGRSAFEKHLSEFQAGGGNLNDAMCFVWCFKEESESNG